MLDGFERCLRDLPDATLTMIYSEHDLLAAVRQQVQRSPMPRERVRLIGAVPPGDCARALADAGRRALEIYEDVRNRRGTKD